MLVSRLITRTSGARSSSIRRASPQGQEKPARRGIGPLARSARRTYARASPTCLSRSSGSPGCGRTWSTPRPVITSPHKNRVSGPSPISSTLPGDPKRWPAATGSSQMNDRAAHRGERVAAATAPDIPHRSRRGGRGGAVPSALAATAQGIGLPAGRSPGTRRRPGVRASRTYAAARQGSFQPPDSWPSRGSTPGVP